tara:strand:+ start:229 stop:771 length:543 start_codon:yes stop_codon:yes gene_type:complete
MSGWLYLIRNRDLYKIGITKNFKNRMRQLKPDKVVAKLYTSDFLKLEKELHSRYKKFRIPQTEYFRLEDYHLKEIKLRISMLNLPMSIILGIFIKTLLFLLLMFFIILIFISLFINDKYIIILNSLLWMERISFGFSLISLFVYSGKYLSFINEIKYRLSKLIIFIILAFCFRMASVFLQ